MRWEAPTPVRRIRWTHDYCSQHTLAAAVVSESIVRKKRSKWKSALKNEVILQQRSQTKADVPKHCLRERPDSQPSSMAITKRAIL